MRIARHALPIVLMLAVAPTTAVAQWGAQPAYLRAGEDSLVCQAIRRGESATQVARRVTGDARNTYQASFQIMNASSRFIPKSQYDRIRAGWRACVIKPVIERAAQQVKALDARDASQASRSPGAPDAPAPLNAVATTDALEGADHLPPVAADVLRVIGSADLTLVWLGAAMVVPWFGWRILDEYLARRRTMAIVMRHFAERFVDEFERPLILYDDTERALRSRLRYGVRRGRFEILLAPTEGRRYPNLWDHKKNVEYDVARVLDVLADESFVRGAIYAQAGWVVVPFQFKAGRKQAGVICISSF